MKEKRDGILDVLNIVGFSSQNGQVKALFFLMEIVGKGRSPQRIRAEVAELR